MTQRTPQQIKLWQSDDMMVWLYESYQISTFIYAEVAYKKNLDETYYTEHLSIVRLRIEQAGIRLAGVLNNCFEN
ncbi:S1/P1 nuclease [uncultured Mucilaginibacter sp.]|uniref:S1/P1 nuclease n=1 Tax=uncultured Mucilaginibacter sp. TaxID=797541 RepID=UPI0025DDE555|nr:S1/P1 nuclease [uncultured Mucilaginibacter sp.]